MPGNTRRVIRVMSQLIADDVTNPRASVGDMEDGLLVYVPWYNEVCLGTGLKKETLSCAHWWVIVPPYALEKSAPLEFRLFGPILDHSLLGSLDAEVIIALREPVAQSA